MLVFRRHIDIRSQSEGDLTRVRASLEDDYHHFCVELSARDQHIVGIRAFAPRHPYSLCPHAADALNLLIGQPCSPVAHSIIRYVQPTVQCTHMLELSGLAMASAAQGYRSRVYEAEIPRWQTGPDGRARATSRLKRDGAAILEWLLEGNRITDPPPYAGISIKQGLAKWAIENLPLLEAEAALILRRCASISRPRDTDFDSQTHAADTSRCFVEQPERAPQALRMIGTTWDFTARPEDLGAADRSWLAFEKDEPPHHA